MEEDITLIVRGGVPYAGGDGAAGEGVTPPDGFAIERILGRGGMGVVYLARRKEDGREVALKVLDPAMARQEKVAERFQREARLMMELDHPNIVKAYEVGLRGECYYLSMEHVAGETLAAMIRREGRIGEFDALRLMRQVADAVDYGSRQGIVHRDLKPDNIIVREDGVCKLTDLGLAVQVRREEMRLTAAGTAVGTPLYMSPEQASCEKDIDGRSDVYSLGCVFYHVLCGRPPFQGQDGLELLRSHLKREPARPCKVVPGLREDVEAVILKCIRKERQRRYAGGAEIVQAIDIIMLAAGEDPRPVSSPASASASSSVSKPEKRPSSRRFSDDVDFSFGDSAPPESDG